MSLSIAKFLLLAFISMLVMYLFQPTTLVVDELAHTPQIKSILAGKTEHLSNITTFIYIHHVYAMMIDTLGLSDPIDFRWLNFAVLALLIITLAHICQAKYHQFPALMAAQLFFIPIAFPYYPLIYTDIIALFFLYWSYHHFRQSWHGSAAIFAALAVLVRQPSLVWLGCFAAMTFFARMEGVPIREKFSQLMPAVFKSLPYILVILAFLIYFYLNKGIALGDKLSHPISINITNFYFMVLVFLLVFLPLLLSRFKQVAELLNSHRWLWLVVVICWPIYILTFDVIHHYNDQSLNMFLRNLMINSINENMGLKALAFLASCYTVLAIISIKFKQAIYNWLYFFIPLSVIAMPLIEQRYYMVGMAFWQLSRNSLSRPIEMLQLIWMAAFAWLLYIGVANEWFFL